MGVVVVVPKDCYPLAYETLGNSIKHPIEFEGCVVFCVAMGSGARNKLFDECCAANYIGFANSTSSKVMWKDTLSFDATGAVLVNQPWQVNTNHADAVFYKLEMRAGSGELKDFTSAFLLQYAQALTGPAFCPKQLEYGKRHKLRKMLLD